MATHVITVLCASPADAQNTLVRIREIGFPIEKVQIVNCDVLTWIDQQKTNGIIYVMEQIRALGFRPLYIHAERYNG